MGKMREDKKPLTKTKTLTEAIFDIDKVLGRKNGAGEFSLSLGDAPSNRGVDIGFRAMDEFRNQTEKRSVEVGVFRLPIQEELDKMNSYEANLSAAETPAKRMFDAGRSIERKNIIEFLDKADNAKDLIRRIQMLKSTVIETDTRGGVK